MSVAWFGVTAPYCLSRSLPRRTAGFFLQVSNVGSAASDVSILLNATPGFVAKSAAVSLFANVINQTGVIAQYSPATFLTAPVGIKSQTIPAGDTWLFGVQYILAPGTSEATIASTPQDAVGTRGTVVLNATAGSLLALTATIRQVFTNYSPIGDIIDINESAYALPLLSGPLLAA